MSQCQTVLLKGFKGKEVVKTSKTFPYTPMVPVGTYSIESPDPHTHKRRTCDRYLRTIQICLFSLPFLSKVWNALLLSHLSREPDQSCILCYCFHFYREDFSPWLKIHRPNLLYPQYNTWKKKLFINLRSP